MVFSRFYITNVFKFEHVSLHTERNTLFKCSEQLLFLQISLSKIKRWMTVHTVKKRGSSNSEPNFLAEIQVNIGQKHLRILHSFSQPPRVITSPSTYTHKFAFDIRLAARIMAWYCSAISIVRLTHIRVFSATSASNFEPDQTSQNFIFRKLYLKIKYFWGEITPSVILKMNEWHDIQSEKFTFEFNCSSIVSQLKILCNLHTCFTTKWLIFFSWELPNNFIW